MWKVATSKKIMNVYRSYDASDGGTHSINFVDCTGRSVTDVGVVAKPTYEYTAIAVSEVEEAILNTYGAGATLMVDEEGNVWIPDGEGTSIESPKSSEWTITQTNNSIKINDIVVSELSIYSISGVLLTQATNCSEININHLSKDSYILKIKTQTNEVFTKKFIKQ
jgi:hypothetical protein